MDCQFSLQPFTDSIFSKKILKMKVGKFPKKVAKIDQLFGNNLKKFRYIIVSDTKT